MPRTYFDRLGEIGVISDVPQEALPKNAWTGGQNVRFNDTAVEKFTGEQEVYASPLAAPYYATPIQVGASYFWHYASLNDIYATNGASHYLVSEATAGYSATPDINWTGGVLSGGVNIMNNGIDAPAMWTGSAVTDKYAALSNWPASMTARVLRPFKQFLVAGDIDEGGGRNGTLLRWSHPAEPGAVPSSWDYTDPTNDSGRTQLGQTSDYIMDMWPLRDLMMIYKENSVWSMQYTGGSLQFAFRNVFLHIGALSRRCIKEFMGKHIVMGYDDVVVHDGNQADSILNSKWRKWLYANIDEDAYLRSFIAINYSAGEVWMCIPQQGYTLPNIALVWNWKYNTTQLRELPASTSHIEWGIVDPQFSGEFNSDSGTFDTAAGLFDEKEYAGAHQYMLICDHNHSKFLKADTTNQFDGSNMTAYVERNFLPLGRMDQNGNIKTDHAVMKFIREIEPVINGTVGGVVNIYLGVQDHIGDAVSWKGPYPYTIGTTRKINTRVTGRIISIKFESKTDLEWRMEQYSVEYELGGSR